MVEKKAEEREEAVAEIKKKDRSGQTRGVFFNTIKINRECLVYEKREMFCRMSREEDGEKLL